ncbi:hypothetical protein ACEWY4_006883 [Coilia grayii]|uniref:Ig-like domain-containing protein n=1 Tax=Coilia grayii TaxID=363190 RepID=A0ABD1KEP0_9TELE
MISIAHAFIYYIKVMFTGVIPCDGIEEKRVKQGGNVYLLCDINTNMTGLHTKWFRNCSHSHQPPLVISPTLLSEKSMSRFILRKNNRDSYDLEIRGVTESDLGTYYCAITKKEDEIEQCGKTITRVLLTENVDKCEESVKKTDSSASAPLPAPSLPPPPLTDCGQCWMMVYILSAVCSLLCVILISICIKKDTQKDDGLYSHWPQFKVQGLSKEHQCLSNLRGEPCLHTEVIYRLLDSSHSTLNQ